MKKYFTPIPKINVTDVEQSGLNEWTQKVQSHVESGFPDLKDIDIVIMGVPEETGAINNKGCKLAPDAVRAYLNQLSVPDRDVKIADLGNLVVNDSKEDTYRNLRDVVSQLRTQNILSIIIGGSHDLTLPQFSAHHDDTHVPRLLVVDERFDMIDEKTTNARSFLSHLLANHEKAMNNLTLIGFQSYYIKDKTLKTLETGGCELIRLGQIRDKMETIEPHIRNSDLLSFDISSIKLSDAPGNGNASPNGFYGEHACQVMRYAGLSDKITSVGIYEVNPTMDSNAQTVQLAAQMIWYLVDGYYQRTYDDPAKNRQNFTKFQVEIKDVGHDLVFWKSERSDKWWVEVPVSGNADSKELNSMLPCTYQEYLTANEGEIPERWFREMQKLS